MGGALNPGLVCDRKSAKYSLFLHQGGKTKYSGQLHLYFIKLACPAHLFFFSTPGDLCTLFFCVLIIYHLFSPLAP